MRSACLFSGMIKSTLIYLCNLYGLSSGSCVIISLTALIMKDTLNAKQIRILVSWKYQELHDGFLFLLLVTMSSSNLSVCLKLSIPFLHGKRYIGCGNDTCISSAELANVGQLVLLRCDFCRRVAQKVTVVGRRTRLFSILVAWGK